MSIDVNKKYSLQEVVDLRLIPGVTGYYQLYNMVTDKVVDSTKKVGHSRRLATETTAKQIKAESDTPWTKISGKIYIKGIEIIKFRKIHNL